MPNDYKIVRNNRGAMTHLEVYLTTRHLLTHPFLNKGTAFTQEERRELQLEGLLPEQIETIENQSNRAYLEFQQSASDLDKFLYLHGLHNRNETLFYYLLKKHSSEMMPIIYTPTVGEAVEKFNTIFRYPRGLYMAYPHRDHMEELLNGIEKEDIDLMVVTDGERVLGLGDQGVGGMSIGMGKAMLYTLCAGIHPERILPVQLDVGTNNQKLLRDPLYLGWHSERVLGAPYDDFIEQFISAVHKKFPRLLLHWEDFGRDNARKNLLRFRDVIRSFNDDIQGTAVVVTASLLSALRTLHQTWSDQRIVIFGAGAAGVGIADQLVRVMQDSGISSKKAQEKIWLVNRQGLITDSTEEILDFQKPYVKERAAVQSWAVTNPNSISLLEVINHLNPSILIGASTVKDAFSEEIVKTMAAHVERPIIMPLSNPNTHSEAKPQDIVNWTAGKALIATGSPFHPTVWRKREHRVTQCNNVFVFPGIGLGAIAVKAEQITDAMLAAACYALASYTNRQMGQELLLPPLEQIQEITRHIAIAVAEQAIKDHVATATNIDQAIKNIQWEPNYFPYLHGEM